MITHRGAETLHTKRLTLRQIRPEDSGDMFKNWAADPKVNRFLWWELHRDEAESRRIIEDWKTDRPDHYHWIIVCDGEGVGTIGCPIWSLMRSMKTVRSATAWPAAAGTRD